MVDVGSMAGSVIFLLLGVSIVLAPQALNKVPQALNKKTVVLGDDLLRYPAIRYLLGLAAIAVGWVLFRLAIFLPPL